MRDRRLFPYGRLLRVSRLAVMALQAATVLVVAPLHAAMTVLVATIGHAATTALIVATVHAATTGLAVTARQAATTVLAVTAVLTATTSLALDSPGVRLTDPAALYHDGLIAAQAGEYSRAREQFEAAIAAAPEFLEAQLNLGLVQQLLRDPARARAAFERVLVLDPSHASARRSLAAVLQELGEDSLALNTYEIALREDSTKTDLYYRRAELIQRLSKEPEDTAKAVAALRRALVKDPRHPEAFAAALGMGTLLVQMEDLPGALRAYERALVVEPKSPAAHYNCAVVLERLMRVQEAVTHLENAIRLRDSYGAAEFALAAIYYRHLENDEKAVLHYEAAAKDTAFAQWRIAEEHAAALRTYLERQRAED